VKIKTEKGASLITLENNCQVDVGENTLLSFDRNDQMHLTQGAINFRLPPTAELSFKVGDLTVIRSTHLQASKTPSVLPPNSEATIGSISVHPNGAITVKILQRHGDPSFRCRGKPSKSNDSTGRRYKSPRGGH
jgi:hypothetical protein